MVFWVLSLLAAVYLGLLIGYKYAKILEAIRSIEERLKVKLDKRKTPEEEHRSQILDAYDPVFQAKVARDELMRKINGEDS